MIYDELLIRNLALYQIGVQAMVSLTEDTMQKQVTDSLYPVCRDRLLASGYYDFAIRREIFDTPATTVPEEWRYLYRYDLPSYVLRVLEVYRNPCGEPLDNWEETGKQLCVDYDPVYAVVAVEADVTEFSDLFVDALSALMASEMAIPMTKNEQLRTQTFNLYIQKLAEAKAYNSAYKQKRDKRTSTIRKARFR